MSWYTAASWTLTIGVISAVVYTYKPDIFTGRSKHKPEAPGVHADASAKSTGRRSKSKKNATSTESPPTSSTDRRASKKRKAVPVAVDSPGQAQEHQSPQIRIDRDENAGLGDQEFAQQLAKAQSGTKLQSSGAQDSRNGVRSTKRADKGMLEPVDVSAELSSTGGQDADDDLSSADSEPQETPLPGSLRAGDVSDMLEAPVTGPSTIRLTGVSTEARDKKKPAAKQFETVMTKKERAQKAKKEEQRRIREESDRIHEAKKQEQLRTARMAAGTSHQTKANQFAATANAWQAGKVAPAVRAAPATTPAAVAPLLDTFEPESNNLSQPNGSVHVESFGRKNGLASTVESAGALKSEFGAGVAGAIVASEREAAPNRTAGDWNAEMSEEDQMRLLQEQQQDEAWESVPTKKSKRRGRTDDTTSEMSVTRPAAISTDASRPSNAAAKVDITSGDRFNSIRQPEQANRGTSSFGALADAEWEA